jgi:hypothetical protein
MEIPQSPNSNESQDAPDASPQQPGTRKRRRIPYTPTNVVLSSEQFKSDEPENPDLEADVTEEDLILLGDPDLDQDEGADELPGNDHYLDDTDFDGDLLNEESGRRAGSGGDLDMPDDDLDYAGSGMAQEDDEDDFLGRPEDEGGTIDHDDDMT